MTGAIIFFPLYFLFLYAYIHPDWLYYAIVTARDEPFPVFLTGKAFFLSHCGSIGGISDYFSALVSQSYSLSWLGAAVTTLLSVGIYYALRRIIHAEKHHRHGMVVFFPALVSLCMMNRYELPIPLMTNSLIVLSCILLYGKCAARNRTLRLLTVPLFITGAILLAGRGAFLFWIVMVINVLRSERKTFLFLAEIGTSVLVVITIFIVAFNSNGGSMPLYYSFSTGRLRVYWFDWAFMASIAVGCAFPAMAGRLHALRGQASYQKFGIGEGIAIAITCLFACFFFSHNDWIRNHIRLESLTHRRQWNEILAFSKTMRRKDLDVTAVYDINCALYHTGKLASRMFEYPQSIDALLLPAALEKSPVSLGLRYAHFYFELGEVNVAQQKLYEIFETATENPLVLKSIAETHMVKNQIAAATLVYTRLAQDLVYGKYARTMLHNIEKNPAKGMDAGLKAIQGLRCVNDTVRNVLDVAEMCQELLRCDNHNKMAFEYLMALYLLAGDLESFSRNIDRAKDFGYVFLPRHWSEALALYIDLVKSDDRNLRELAGEESMRQCANFKKSFIGVHQDWDVGNIRESSADSPDAKRLRPVFGSTYLYYFFFQQSGLIG